MLSEIVFLLDIWLTLPWPAHVRWRISFCPCRILQMHLAIYLMLGWWVGVGMGWIPNSRMTSTHGALAVDACSVSRLVAGERKINGTDVNFQHTPGPATCRRISAATERAVGAASAVYRTSATWGIPIENNPWMGGFWSWHTCSSFLQNWCLFMSIQKTRSKIIKEKVEGLDHEHKSQIGVGVPPQMDWSRFCSGHQGNLTCLDPPE